MTAGEFEAGLRRFLTRWEEAEASIKRAEQLQGEVTIPAINELRYAGRHILRAIAASKQLDPDPAVLEQAMSVASQYLTNAEHDVVDAVVVFVGRRVDELNIQFGKSAIIETFPAYGQLTSILSLARKNIAASRGDSRNRHVIYNELKTKIIPSLVENYETVVDADVIMGARVAMMQAEVDRYVDALAKVTAMCVTLAVILAIVIIFIAVR